MGWIVAGRLIQGFGGGLEVAVAYVVVRGTFPEAVWSRTIALMSGSWSMSVLIGPLVGGMFARFGNWRGAFDATAITAGVLAVTAFSACRRWRSSPHAGAARARRTCRADLRRDCRNVFGVDRRAALLQGRPDRRGDRRADAMLRLDRAAAAPLLPSDAFSLRHADRYRAVAGAAALRHLQPAADLRADLPAASARPRSAGGRLRGCQRFPGVDDRFAPHSWRIEIVADRQLSAGPAIMGASLMAIALLLPSSISTLALVPAIVLLGVGIGQCWPFVAQRVMGGAKPATRRSRPHRFLLSSRWVSRWSGARGAGCKCQRLVGWNRG